MRSGFGVERDAGRRLHEGIDIFAPKGTDVVAVAGGIARTGTNRLGGNVVWVYAPGEGRTFYYAHLDRSAIGAVALVEAGDVLGYVGNTGNAARTPPHLHFGIYDDGAIDPWPFVAPDQPVPAATPRSRPRPRSVRRPPA
jgi:murein DD-endopeptidase MepM/ murein hydrolase activator NlpD